MDNEEEDETEDDQYYLDDVLAAEEDRSDAGDDSDGEEEVGQAQGQQVQGAVPAQTEPQPGEAVAVLTGRQVGEAVMTMIRL